MEKCIIYLFWHCFSLLNIMGSASAPTTHCINTGIISILLCCFSYSSYSKEIFLSWYYSFVVWSALLCILYTYGIFISSYGQCAFHLLSFITAGVSLPHIIYFCVLLLLHFKLFCCCFISILQCLCSFPAIIEYVLLTFAFAWLCCHFNIFLLATRLFHLYHLS